MAENDPVYIISDNPEPQNREFGFKGYARTLAGLIANSQNETPLTIGIYGPWGAGKTTLMESVKNLLDKHEFKDKSQYRTCKTVWFQAWKYKDEDEILAALIESIFKAMHADKFFEKCKAEIESLTKKIDKSKIVASISKLFTGIDVTEFFSELDYKDKLGFFDTFQYLLSDLIWTYLNWRAKLTVNENVDDKKGALVIFIDDLDRCPEKKIIRVLETIKLFMDKKGCVFVIGADEDVIVTALSKEYEDDARRFMEKIVQVSFKLPRIAPGDFKPFVENMDLDISAKLFPHLELLMPAMKHNPRQLKRFVNNLNLLDGLLKNRETPVHIDFKHLLLWNIIDLVYPTLAEDIKDRPKNLYLLQKFIDKIGMEKGADQFRDLTPEQLKEIPKSFHGYLADGHLVGIVREFDIPENEFEILRTLSGTLEAPEELETISELAEKPDFQHDAMVEVGAGDFIYGDKGKEETVTLEAPCKIDIYPVTNREFETFVLNSGYEREELWEPAGWKWRKSENITEPRFWKDPKWRKPDHPVVGVSWHEAAAYAKWLNKRLPTEHQWERAARGTKGNVYPWGDDFDPAKCNTIESGIGGTTRVTRYPGGISPEGCYDMAGNVWEWTSIYRDDDRDTYALRGGSWHLGAVDSHCASRNWSLAFYRLNSIGFRCVRTLK